jgi:integrase
VRKITVSPYPGRPKTPWKVDVPATLAGRRIRKFFSSKEAAGVWADEKRKEFFSVGQQAFSNGLTLSNAIVKFLPRVSEGSDDHRKRTKGILETFGKRYGSRALENIGPMMIEDYLLEIVNKNTRASHYRYLRMLFRWAWRMELIARNPMNAIDAPTTSPKRNILTPENMEHLLELKLPDWLKNVHVIGGFAGLRSSEMLALRHEDIDHKRKLIHVRPGTQKGEEWRERYVDFTEPLRRHLKKGKGPIAPADPKKLSEARAELIVKPLEWARWPEGCLRHSFATYHLAKYQDAAKTAHQMGHTSIQMVTRVYAQPARGVTADAWWKL